MRLLYFLIFSLLINHAYGQLEGANWHFGDGQAISFNGGTLTQSTSSIYSGFYIKPATISSSTGELKLYADQNQVYSSDGEPLPNGYFSDYGFESILIPDPGNPDRYYLIRSRSTQGMFYSVIDMTLNGGMGDIPEGLKEINLYNLGGHLMVISKADAIGYWLISADNDFDGDYCFIRTFDVSANGISFHAEYNQYWNLVSWAGLDDAVISNDCNMIAVSFKGHFIGLFLYDHYIGNCTAVMEESINTYTSFVNSASMAFSPNGDYLYAVGQYSVIKRFNVSVFDNETIQASSEEIALGPPGQWKDIQQAVDGNLYIFGQAGVLSRISNSNEPDPTFESSILTFSNFEHTFFPIIPHLACGQSFLINPQTNDVCLGETTDFELSATFTPDSVLWNFGDPNSGELNTSDLVNPTHFYAQTGSYNVSASAWLDGVEFTFDLVANVYAYPETNLLENQTICQGQVITLDAGIAETYEWSTGSTDQQITVSQTGTYSVIASNGICSVESIAEIEVIPQLIFGLGDDIVVCDEPSVLLTANQAVVWNNGTTSPQITVNESGFYSATAENECFSITDTIEVLFINVPPNLLPENLEACWGDTLYFYTGIPEAQVYWENNNTLEGDSLQVTSSGSYNVSYTYLGCPANDVVNIEYFPLINPVIFQMPNVFTPNGDAQNDFYHPINPYSMDDPCTMTYLESNMRIYNRWGGLISDGECSWDGFIENNPAAEGVYYYLIELKSTCLGREHIKNMEGDFTLKR